MGLDQYAYVAMKERQQDEFWENAEKDPVTGDWINAQVEKPRELMYWRKHPNLQGWMRELWARKCQPEDDPMFNGVELELTWEDLDELEAAVQNGLLPPTNGFFFGDDSDEYYKEQDLEFIKRARAELFMGLRVFYNSSW